LTGGPPLLACALGGGQFSGFINHCDCFLLGLNASLVR
jgi:hypothetical protein